MTEANCSKRVILSPDLLSNLETCQRKTAWGQSWESSTLHPTEIAYRGITAALLEAERPDYGEVAGETVMELCADRGLDSPHTQSLYDIGVHHAAIADLVATFLRRDGGTWARLPQTALQDGVAWDSRCFYAGNRLQRVLLVDHWDEERQAAESHSWYTLGEIAAYELPMTLRIIVLGTSKFGRRYSAWSRGLLHPRNHQLRFKVKAGKKRAQVDGGFASSWEPIWREDHAEIDRQKWLDTMAADGVLGDVALERRIEVPRRAHVENIRRDAIACGTRINALPVLPQKSYGGCDRPRPCQFRRCCWAFEEMLPRASNGFRAPVVGSSTCVIR